MSMDGGRPHYDLSVPEREASIALPNLLFTSPNESFDEFLLNDEQSAGFFDILYRTSHVDLEEGEITEMAHIRSARLAGQIVTYLADLFPNVNNLMVIHSRCYEDELHSVIGLLEVSSWSLVTLKLWLITRDFAERYQHRPNEHPIGSLLRGINQQSSLQHLTLDIEDHDNHLERYGYSFPEEAYSFIGQLKVVKLYLQYYDSHNSIWDAVNRFDSASLHQIGLDNCADCFVNFALNPQLKYTAKVSQLYQYRYFDTVEELAELVQRFTSLTTLKILWPADVTFAQLVINLASLRQLTYLQLLIFFVGLDDHPFTLMDVGVAEGGGGEEPRRISLPQVKTLRLVMAKWSHNNLESLCPLAFPSVEMIILKEIEQPVCVICQEYMDGQNSEYDLEVASKCHRLFCASLSSKMANSSVRIYPAFESVITRSPGHHILENVQVN